MIYRAGMGCKTLYVVVAQVYGIEYKYKQK